MTHIPRLHIRSLGWTGTPILARLESSLTTATDPAGVSAPKRSPAQVVLQGLHQDSCG